MRSIQAVFGLIFGLFLALSAQAYAIPDPDLTPGAVCSADDPDFRGLDYPERIARCNRNVSNQQKLQVAKTYGDVPRSEWPNYEFDHLIPLCAGGSNSSKNIWPQPLDQAKKKDVLENEICLGMRSGTLTQVAAVQKVKDWFEALKVKTQDKGPGGEPGSTESAPADQPVFESDGE